MAKLTILQRRTCEIYHSMAKPNQAEAYRLAGSKCRGKTLIEEAHRTLKKPQCREYLKRLQKKSEEQAVKSAGEIIAELEKVGFSNIKDYIEVKEGTLTIKDLNKMTEAQAAAIAEISETTAGAIKFKLYDKPGALKALGLRFGIFPTKIEATGKFISLSQAVHDAMKDEKG